MGTTFSELPEATDVVAADLIAVVDVSDTPPAAGLTKQATIGQLTAGGDSTTAVVDDANPQSFASADADKLILRLTGALTSVRTVGGLSHPSSGQGYRRIIINDCTGANVIVSTGTGTTAEIPLGTIRTVVVLSTGVRLI